MDEPQSLIGTFWTPRPPTASGPKMHPLYVSHQNNRRPEILVCFLVRGGLVDRNARLDLHPRYLAQRYERQAPESSHG